jgi:hypothetical protein
MDMKIPIENTIEVVPCEIYIKVRVEPLMRNENPLVEQALKTIEWKLQSAVSRAVDQTLKESE